MERPQVLRTTLPEHIERKWHLVDARGMILGRLASQVATLLRGKHRPIFTPHQDTGEHVVVINAAEVVLTGGKGRQKIYYHHSGYRRGGLKAVDADTLRSKHPERLMEKAVRGMLPKNRIGRAMFKKLKVYRGDRHPHQAQGPEPLTLEGKAR